MYVIHVQYEVLSLLDDDRDKYRHISNVVRLVI